MALCLLLCAYSTCIKLSTFLYSEPNNLEGIENCVQIYTLINGTWNDIKCDDHYQSICEMGHEVQWGHDDETGM